MAVGNAELQALTVRAFKFVEANLASTGTRKIFSQVHRNFRYKHCRHDTKY